MQNKTTSTSHSGVEEEEQVSNTDRVVKFRNAWINEVIAFTPVHVRTTSLQLVPKNEINVRHVAAGDSADGCLRYRENISGENAIPGSCAQDAAFDKHPD